MTDKLAEWLGYLLSADMSACLTLLGAYALFFILKSYRWGIVLRSVVHIPFRDLIPVTVTGYAANLLVPHSGELLRSFQVGRRYKVGKTTVLASIFVERILDIISLLIFTVAILLYDNNSNQYLEKTAYFVGVVIFGMLLFAILALNNSKALSGLIEKALFWLPRSLKRAVLYYVSAGAEGLVILKDLSGFFLASLISLVQWLLILCCVWLSLSAIGIYASPLAIVLIVVLMIIGIALPTAPGYVGTTQVCFIVAGGVFDWPTSQTIAASVIYNLLMSLPVFLWAGWYSVGFPGSRGWHLKFTRGNKQQSSEEAADS